MATIVTEYLNADTNAKVKRYEFDNGLIAEMCRCGSDGYEIDILDKDGFIFPPHPLYRYGLTKSEAITHLLLIENYQEIKHTI